MTRRLPEVLLSDPSSWGTAITVVGLIILFIEMGQSGSVMFLGALPFVVGVAAFAVRDDRRRIAGFHARRKQ